MNINFDYYKIFYYVAKNKNITKTANELSIAQPAISRTLKNLEEQLNTKLFIRERKGMVLTKEGEELYNLVKDGIKNIINADTLFAKSVNNKNRKIATSNLLLNYLITTKRLDNILESKDNLSFININDFDLLNNQLINNTIDFAIVIEPTNYQFNKEIIFKAIDELHLILVSNSNKMKTEDNSIVIQDKNSKFGMVTIDYLEKSEIKGNRLIIVDSYDNILPLVKKEDAIGVVIKEFIINELNSKKIYEISTSIKSPCINIGILYNKNNELKIKKIFE